MGAAKAPTDRRRPDSQFQALVEHTTARLRFWEHLGILFIQPNGQFQEITDANQIRIP